MTGSDSLKSTMAFFPKWIRLADAVRFSDRQGVNGFDLRGVARGGVMGSFSTADESGDSWLIKS